MLDLYDQLMQMVPEPPLSRNHLPNISSRQRLMMRRVRLATLSLILHRATAISRDNWIGCA